MVLFLGQDRIKFKLTGRNQKHFHFFPWNMLFTLEMLRVLRKTLQRADS